MKLLPITSLYYSSPFTIVTWLTLLPCLPCSDALAFAINAGDLSGSLDTTLSYGQLYRVQGQDKNNDDINTNDGNRNFSNGLVSEAFSITSQLKLNYRNYGLTLKGRGYYDSQIMKSNDYFKNNRTPEPSQGMPYNHFTDKARDLSGRKVELLDAYISAHWDVFDHPFSLIVGKQVINWGESMFYRGGVNTGINALDLSTYRLMNYNLSDLKELYIPIEAVSFNLGLTDNLSLEAFYQWRWKKTILPPVGTFFSETDLLADGAHTAWADQAADMFLPIRDIYINALNATGLLANGLKGSPGIDEYGIVQVGRIGKDRPAKDSGQFGISLKYLAQNLNDTEFGLYFVNYHSKEPQLGANMGGYTGYSMLPLVLGQPFWGSSRGFTDLLTDPLGTIERWGIDAGMIMAIDAGGTTRGWREYAENIRLFGISFATTIGPVSVAGELTYSPNTPIGISTTNDIVADLLYQAAFGIDTNPITRMIHGGDGTAMLLGNVETLESTMHNYERVEMFNTSLSAIYMFGQGLTFDSSLLLFNIASEHIHGSSLRYMGYDTSTPPSLTKHSMVERRFTGRPNQSYYEGGTHKDQITRDAFGFTLLLEGTWNNVWHGLTLKPFVVYQEGLKGNSHMLGNFIEGTKAYSVGVRAELDRLEAELQYTEFWGAGRNNQMRDRDNAGFNIKYSF